MEQGNFIRNIQMKFHLLRMFHFLVYFSAWMDHCRHLEAEVEWAKETADRLERVNQTLLQVKYYAYHILIILKKKSLC